MALTVVKPSGIDTTGNYTVNGMTVSANANVANLTANGIVNFTSTSNVSLGAVANLKITGGTANYVLQTDGTGNLSWVAQSGGGGGTPGGTNTQIQFNDGGTFGGNANLTFDKTTSVLTVTGNISALNANLGNLVVSNYFSGSGNLLSNIQAGNITGTVANANYAAYAGNITVAAQANITSLGTLSSLTVTGNVTAGNANLGNLTTSNYFAGTLTTAAQPNITSVGTLTDLNVSGNAVFGGNLTVNGNLTYVNVTDLAVEDPIIQLQTGPNAAAPSSNSGKDVGTALNYYDSQARIAFMGWDVSNAEFGFGNVVSISSEVVTWTSYGNVRAGYFIGNGSQLTGITSAAYANYISNGTSNVNISTASGNVTVSVAGNADIVTITGTGVNVSGTLNVTGNANVGNIGATSGVFTNVSGNGSTLSSLTGGNVTGQVGNALIAGTVYTAAQPNITSVGTLSSLSVTGNISSGNASLGNLTTSNYFAGTLTTAAQPNITSIGTLTSLTITGNVTAGNANLGNLTTSNYFAGTLTTAAQPNITSVGTLSNLTSNGTINFTNASNISLGAVGNLKITGGTANYVLQTDGAGNLSWVAQTGGGGGSSISNGTSNVNIATSGGNVTTSVDGNANILVVTGTGSNINGYLTVSGVSTLGPVGNVKITGGSNGQYLQTDGSGNLSWTSASSGITLTVDTFTGDGTTTVFTLSTTPVSEDYTIVSLAGTFQPRSTYTVSGTTLTFSSAPANTSPIEVTTFAAGGGGGGGASDARVAGYSLVFGL